MHQELQLHQRITILDLPLDDGLVASALPKSQAKLQKQNYRAALAAVTSKMSVMEKYQSMMDFLFVATFPSWHKSCQHYYNDHGPKVKYIIGPGELAACDTIIYDIVLECCLLAAKKRPRWIELRHLVYNATKPRPIFMEA